MALSSLKYLSFYLLSSLLLIFSFSPQVFAKPSLCPIADISNPEDYLSWLQSATLQYEESPTALPVPQKRYWPLLGDHSLANFPLVKTRILLDGDFLQEFADLTLGQNTLKIVKIGEKENKNSVSLQAVGPWQSFRSKNYPDCPEIQRATFKTNTQSEDFIVALKVSGADALNLSKFPHIDLLFPGEWHVRWVEKHLHKSFGISSDLPLLQMRKSYQDEYIDFRNLSGFSEIPTVKSCNQQDEVFYNALDLKSCLKNTLNSINTYRSHIHVNEVNAHWMGRMTINPVDRSLKKQFFSSDVSLSYSPLGDRGQSAVLEFGGQGPKKIGYANLPISQGNTKSIGASRWNKDLQFLHLKLDDQFGLQMQLLNLRTPIGNDSVYRQFEAYYGESFYPRNLVSE